MRLISMAGSGQKTIVMSVEELKARSAIKAAGGNPDNAVETIRLRARVAELEAEAAQFKNIRAARGLTNMEVRRSLDLLLQHYDVEPAEEIIKLAIEKDEAGNFITSRDKRIEIWEGLMQYRNQKLKATEHSGHVDQNINVTVLDFSSRTVIQKQVIELAKDL